MKTALHNGTGAPAMWCRFHGGGIRCEHFDAVEGACIKIALGDGSGRRPKFCRAHGGSRRCDHPDHDHPPSEIEPYPRPPACFKLNGKFLCWQHYHANAGCRAIRRELVLLGHVLCNCPPAVQQAYLGHDFNVRLCALLRRPDMLFAFESFALLIECDENGHRDRNLEAEESHLAVIRQWLQEHHDLDQLYMLRVNPDGKKPMFAKMTTRNGEQVWVPTATGEAKMAHVIDHLAPVLKAGADDDREWIESTFATAVDGVVTSHLFF